MNMTIMVRCIRCRKDKKVVVPEDGYDLWQRGEYIQNAMPTVSASDRELLLSGCCGECYDKLFGYPED